MKKSSKQRLFEVMAKIDNSYKNRSGNPRTLVVGGMTLIVKSLISPLLLIKNVICL